MEAKSVQVEVVEGSDVYAILKMGSPRLRELEERVRGTLQAIAFQVREARERASNS